VRLKCLSQTYSVKKAREKRKVIISSLQKRLRNAQNQNKSAKIADLKAKICEIETTNVKGHYLESKLNWIEEGEQCSKTFLKLTSRRCSQTLVNEIRDSALFRKSRHTPLKVLKLATTLRDFVKFVEERKLDTSIISLDQMKLNGIKAVIMKMAD